MQDAALRQVLERLAAAGVIPHAASALEVKHAKCWARSCAGLCLQKSRRSPILAIRMCCLGWNSHAKDHLDEILRLFSGGGAGDLAFVTEHARRRAERRFPLKASGGAPARVAPVPAWAGGPGAEQKSVDSWLPLATLSSDGPIVVNGFLHCGICRGGPYLKRAKSDNGHRA